MRFIVQEGNCRAKNMAEKEKATRGVLKVVLKIFIKFTGKHLCQSLFFIKVASFSQFLLREDHFREVTGNKVTSHHVRSI